MNMPHGRTALWLSVTMMSGTAQAGPPIQITHPSASANDYFGRVAASGDTIIVGAGAQDVGSNIDQGAAHVYRMVNGSWVHEATLTSNDGAAGDLFGAIVALDGDTAVVGAYAADVAPGVDHGAAYVFIRSGSAWTQQAKLVPPTPFEHGRFGLSVCVDGDTAVVGSVPGPASQVFHRTAYVFTRTNGAWSQQAALEPQTSSIGNSFGWSAALDGNTLIVGAPYDAFEAGAAYVFVRSGESWTQQARLEPTGVSRFDYFGWAVDIQDDTALVSTLYTLSTEPYNGTVHAFARNGVTWSEQAVLTPTDAGRDLFGLSVALTAHGALIGAPFADIGNSADRGCAYVFRRNGLQWTEHEQLTSPIGAAGDRFGSSVAMTDTLALVGAPLQNVDPNTDQGAVWAFESVPPISCPGDANADLVIDAADLSILLSNFGQPAAGPSFSDFNVDGVCNGADLSLLLASFGNRC